MADGLLGQSLAPGQNVDDLVSPSIVTEFVRTDEDVVELAVTEASVQEFTQSLGLPTNRSSILFDGLKVHAIFWHASTNGTPPRRLNPLQQDKVKACGCSLRRISYVEPWGRKFYGAAALCPSSLIELRGSWDSCPPVQIRGLGPVSVSHLGVIADKLVEDLAGII